MRIVLAVMWCVVSVGSSGLAEDADAIQIPVPKDWKGETIKLPPSFARDMKLKGVEHIRFAPGMFEPKSETFFSYVYVFRLEQKPALKAEVIKQEFLKYYRGLAVAVLKDSGVEIDPKKFTLELNPVKDDKKTGAKASELSEYTAELNWVEPFATRKPQKLRLEIQTWSAKKNNFMFICVSPKLKDSAIWKQMREIRAKFHKQASKKQE